MKTVWVLSLILGAQVNLTRAQANLIRSGIQSFNIWSPDASYVSSSLVSATGPGFSQAFQVKVLKKPANSWDVQLNSPALAAVASGDVIAGEIWFRRSDPSGEVTLGLVFERAGDPYTKSLEKEVKESVGEWTRVRFAFTAAENYAAGGANINLRVGFAPQTIEFGPFAMTNYAKTQALGVFPNDTMSASQIANSPVTGGGVTTPFPAVTSFNLLWPDASYATKSIVNVSGTSFSQAVHVQTLKKPANPWDIQLNAQSLSPIAKDDVIAGEVWFRRAAGIEASTTIIFERAGDPYTQSLARGLRDSEGQWTRLRFAFTSAESYAAGGAQMNFQLGMALQTIEIGGLLATNYAKTQPLSAFPNDVKTLVEIQNGEAGSGSLLPPITTFNLQRPDASYASRTVVDVTGQSFAQAVQVQTLRSTANPWEIQLSAASLGPVARNDIVAGEVWIRRVDGARAGTGVIFQRNGDPWTTSFSRKITESDGQWTLYRFAFQSLESYPAGGSLVNFTLGDAVQTIQIGGLRMTNQLQSLPLSAYPNDVTYEGRSPLASWRAAAEARIEQFRKANLTIEVLDQSGQPVKGVPISVRMKKHAFGFGSAVAAEPLLQAGADSDHYRSIITNWFNRVVLENDLKWPNWEANPALAINAVNWLRLRDIELRGHNLIWPSSRYLPANVPPLFTNPAALRTRINSHFTDILGALKGKCVDWDVVNEPVTEHDVMDVLGNSVMVDWLKLARTTDPAAKLYLNDYENVDVGLGDSHSSKFYDICKSMIDQGAPLDGIGLQGHIDSYLNPPTDVLAALDKFGSLGPALSITEFDVNTTDETLQADYTRDFMTIAFSHPKVAAFLHWGFWQSRHWRPDAALFRSNWSIKPNGQVWSNLVFRAWWTDTSAVSDAQGRATIRGFKGSYDIQVPSIDGLQNFPAILDADGTLTVRIPAISLISSVTNQLSIYKNTSTADILLEARAPDNSLDALDFSAASDNPGLTPASAFSFTGTGASRVLRITPARDQVGAALVTVTLKTRDNLTSSIQLSLRVRELPVISPPIAEVLVEANGAEPNQAGKFVLRLTPGFSLEDGIATPIPITGPIFLKYALTGTATAGLDFEALPGSVAAIPAPDGSARADVLVNIIDDAVIEPTETVILSLIEDSAYVRGTVSSATLLITDNDRLPKPEITQAPQSQTVNEGAAVVLAAQAAGGAPLNFEWSFNGNVLVEDGRHIGTATTALTIKSASPNDAGDYTIKVSNSDGFASATAKLDITPLGVASPRLDWKLNATLIEFSWKSPATDFRLEHTPTLIPPIWQTIGVPLSDGNGVWTATIAPQPGYYRLAR